MATSIKFTTTGKQASRIVDTSAKARRLDTEFVRQAFNAERVASTEGLDLFSLREAMTRMLASSGGRPGVEGASAQVKIPRIEADWVKIEQIAHGASTLAHKPSVTQTAALILHLALSRISDADIEDEVRKALG